jgi:C4-type Zn-finger protein
MPSVSSIECPLCSRCRTRMVLIKMEIPPQGTEKRMFECSKCHFIETKIVEEPFKSDAQGTHPTSDL